MPTETFAQTTPPIDLSAVVPFGELVANGETLPIGYCESSNLAFLRNCPTEGHYARMYSDEYWQAPAFVEHERHRAKSANRVGRLLSLGIDLPKAPKILDFGAGYGYGGALLAQKLRGQAVGIEPSTHAAKIAAANGLPIVGKSAADIAGAYDLIALIQVLEHQPHPAKLLTALRDALTPNGILFVDVPDLDGVKSVNVKHPICFSPRALILLLNHCGLKAVAMKSTLNGGPQYRHVISVAAMRGHGGIGAPAAKQLRDVMALHRKHRVTLARQATRAISSFRKIVTAQARRLAG
jgi:SAM-dependent methyltransferase